jgi:hypothetical protein
VALKKFKNNIYMNKEHEQFDAQEAPEKNTDSAYVKVGTDGKPEMPVTEKKGQDSDGKPPKEGTLADR